MAWKRTVLVVANVTATSDELLQALVSRGADEPVSFTLVVPATPFGGGRTAAQQTLEDAVAQLREAGLDVQATVGAADPCVAVTDVWDPKRYDEIIISTLPMRLSKWLHAGLPERVAKLTGAPVIHVISSPPKPAPETAEVRRREPLGVIAPLTVLAWGGPREIR